MQMQSRLLPWGKIFRLILPNWTPMPWWISGHHIWSQTKNALTMSWSSLFMIWTASSTRSCLVPAFLSWNRKVLMIHFKMPSQRSMPLFFFWIPRTAFLLLPVHRSPAEVRWHLRSCTALPKNIFSLRHFPTMTGKLPVSFRNQIFGNRIRAWKKHKSWFIAFPCVFCSFCFCTAITAS